MTKAIMFQGTASDAGKSWIVAAACRWLVQQGYKVAPFKSQNMALNSFITQTGAEMGRAQVFQAEAAQKEPDVRMNPVLLKPSTDQTSQVIVMGQILADMSAQKYYQFKKQLKPQIMQAYRGLAQENDVIVLEGAGSPAEINLNENDIVNMGMARWAQAPVILVADIDKGGVFASIYGTIKLLEPADQKRVCGIIINKFRGDKQLLEPGIRMIEQLTHVPVLGVIPLADVDLDEEDSVVLSRKRQIPDNTKALDIAVIDLKHISNFTDFHSLEIQPDVSLRYVLKSQQLGQPDLIILPGSKNTNEDLAALKKEQLDQAIVQAHQQGSWVVGICGGYQILGRDLLDPDQVESTIHTQAGLGLLDIATTFNQQKTTTQVMAQRGDYQLHGYEIHMGETKLGTQVKPFAQILTVNGQACQRWDGAINLEQRVFGTYLHGLFDNPLWTRHFLNLLRQQKGLAPFQAATPALDQYKETQYQKLAQVFADNVDLSKFMALLQQSEQGSQL